MGLVVYVLVLMAGLWQSRSANKRPTSMLAGILIGLLLLVFITSLFLAVSLPQGNEPVPMPGIPGYAPKPVMVVLLALPWAIAAGVSGPLAAAVLAFVAGTLLMFWSSHNLYTPLDLAILAMLWGSALQQRHRGWLFQLLRRPFLVALALSLFYGLLFILSAGLSSAGSLAERLDNAIVQLPWNWVAMAGMWVVGGLFAGGVAVSWPQLWATRTPLQPSPFERNLYTRFIANFSPLALLLVITLMVGDWVVAEAAARQMLAGRLDSTARVAVGILPIYLEKGQELIKSLGEEPALSVVDPAQLPAVLEELIRQEPFFDLLFVFDKQGNPVGGYPDQVNYEFRPTTEELNGIEMANSGVDGQFYISPLGQMQNEAFVSFLAPILNTEGLVSGVLIGRSVFENNPYTQPITQTLTGLTTDFIIGYGALVDEKGQVLYISTPDYQPGSLPIPEQQGTLFASSNNAGMRQWVYYQAAPGPPWGVILAVPARQTQSLALEIATPLLVVLAVVFVVAGLLLRAGLRTVTGSLQTLTLEADRIAGGQLDHSLAVDSVDEVGKAKFAADAVVSLFPGRGILQSLANLIRIEFDAHVRSL